MDPQIIASVHTPVEMIKPCKAGLKYAVLEAGVFLGFKVGLKYAVLEAGVFLGFFILRFLFDFIRQSIPNVRS